MPHTCSFQTKHLTMPPTQSANLLATISSTCAPVIWPTNSLAYMIVSLPIHAIPVTPFAYAIGLPVGFSRIDSTFFRGFMFLLLSSPLKYFFFHFPVDIPSPISVFNPMANKTDISRTPLFYIFPYLAPSTSFFTHPLSPFHFNMLLSWHALAQTIH